MLHAVTAARTIPEFPFVTEGCDRHKIQDQNFLHLLEILGNSASDLDIFYWRERHYSPYHMV